MAVTLMDGGGVKRVPAAFMFRNPAETRHGDDHTVYPFDAVS
ncbi:hypothetical protein [Streptomyces sp. NPDC047000]